MSSTRTRTTLRVLVAALLAGAMGAAVADNPDTQERDDRKMTERESDQPVNDTWITTKVKADLLTTSDVSGLELNVETVNGVVSLSGDVDSQEEADRAIAVARGIEGVIRVDSSAIRVRPATDNDADTDATADTDTDR